MRVCRCPVGGSRFDLLVNTCHAGDCVDFLVAREKGPLCTLACRSFFAVFVPDVTVWVEKLKLRCPWIPLEPLFVGGFTPQGQCRIWGIPWTLIQGLKSEWTGSERKWSNGSLVDIYSCKAHLCPKRKERISTKFSDLIQNQKVLRYHRVIIWSR